MLLANHLREKVLFYTVNLAEEMLLLGGWHVFLRLLKSEPDLSHRGNNWHRLSESPLISLIVSQARMREGFITLNQK